MMTTFLVFAILLIVCAAVIWYGPRAEKRKRKKRLDRAVTAERFKQMTPEERFNVQAEAEHNYNNMLLGMVAADAMNSGKTVLWNAPEESHTHADSTPETYHAAGHTEYLSHVTSAGDDFSTSSTLQDYAGSSFDGGSSDSSTNSGSSGDW